MQFHENAHSRSQKQWWLPKVNASKGHACFLSHFSCKNTKNKFFQLCWSISCVKSSNFTNILLANICCSHPDSIFLKSFIAYAQIYTLNSFLCKSSALYQANSIWRLSLQKREKTKMEIVKEEPPFYLWINRFTIFMEGSFVFNDSTWDTGWQQGLSPEIYYITGRFDRLQLLWLPCPFVR